MNANTENNSKARYKYPCRSIPRLYFKSSFNYLLFWFSITICFLLSLNYFDFTTAAIGLTVFLITFYITIDESGRITIDDNFLVYGDKVIYYRGIKSIIIDEQAQTLIMTTHTGKKTTIKASKFHSNANKPHKIAANKEAKFYKTVNKVLNKSQGKLAIGALQIIHPKHLKHHQNPYR